MKENCRRRRIERVGPEKRPARSPDFLPVSVRQPVACVVEASAGISDETKYIQWSYTLQLVYSDEAIISKFRFSFKRSSYSSEGQIESWAHCCSTSGLYSLALWNGSVM